MDLEVTRQDISKAATRIDPHIRRTPVISLGDVFERGYDLSLKLDHTQPTGSFKVRGAFSLLTAVDPENGVAAASGGNYGIAVAHACVQLGYNATIFVPETSPREKVDRIRDLADVRIIPGYYQEALAECDRFVAERGAFMAHAYDQAEVVAGQGTAAKEVLEQVPDVDTILVAVGGGGLIGGVASWSREDVKVIATEPEGCSSFHAARLAGRPVKVDVGGVASSSLGASMIGDFAWYASKWVNESVLVTDDEIVNAQRDLWDRAKLAVEPSAATTVAVLISEAYRPEPGEHVVALLSGANFDLSTI